MSLASSLQIGRSALTASQIALQVTGNNFANAATPGYSRQIAYLSPTGDEHSGNVFLGRGVFVQGVRRQVDSALQARLWSGISQESRSSTDLQLMSAVESTLNELSDSDLSSELSRFFNSWSELANSPGATGTRSLVVQQGATLAAAMRTLRADLANIRTQADRQLDAQVVQADALLAQVASLNASIVTAESGSAQANSLRDQRDGLITQLSAQLDISTIEQPSGAIDVLVGSTPVVLAGQSRGLRVVRLPTAAGDDASVTISTKVNTENIAVSSGSIGSILSQREVLVNDTIGRLDSIASQLIFQVNRIHSTGYGASTLTAVNGNLVMPAADAARALNDPANATTSGLPFHAVNGGFTVTLTSSATGAAQTVRIPVDLDGLDGSGRPGFGDDTSVNSLGAALNAVPNLRASVGPDGTLSISAAPGFKMGFSDDSSGALAVLGVNTYFTGSSARTIDVGQNLKDQPALLNAGAFAAGGAGSPSDNGSALAIAGLQDAANAALGGQTVRGAWQNGVQSIALRTDAAKTRADSTTLVRENLDAQRSSVSGVSVDEESINMLTEQRQYQGAARFITVIDELTQTLIGLIR